MISENIIKYRKENNYSQLELAQILKISRQSISKWETGENLPSIDNLLSLSGLFNISIDELITGDSYLHFPFYFGKPKSKLPFYCLTLPFLIILLVGIHDKQFFQSLGIIFLLFPVIIFLNPFDFKRYYTYWQFDKLGIYNGGPRKTNFLDELWLPFKGVFFSKKKYYFTYKDIATLELSCLKYGYNPAEFNVFNAYSPRMIHIVNEPFFLIVTTKNGDVMKLDLWPYENSDSDERKYLPSLLAYLERKGIPLVDHEELLPIIKKRESVINYIYRTDKPK